MRARGEKGTTEDEMVGCIIASMDMILSRLQKIVKDREAWHAAVHKVAELDMSYRPNNNKAPLTCQEEKAIVTL